MLAVLIMILFSPGRAVTTVPYNGYPNANVPTVQHPLYRVTWEDLKSMDRSCDLLHTVGHPRRA